MNISFKTLLTYIHRALWRAVLRVRERSRACLGSPEYPSHFLSWWTTFLTSSKALQNVRVSMIPVTSPLGSTRSRRFWMSSAKQGITVWCMCVEMRTGWALENAFQLLSLWTYPAISIHTIRLAKRYSASINPSALRRKTPSGKVIQPKVRVGMEYLGFF